MKDRVSRYPNRRLITPIDGSTPYYADITRADEATEPGTPLNKANLLADDTAALLGLGTDATVNQALAAAAEMGSGLGGKVYAETSTSPTERTVTIEGVESWDDVLNQAIYIKTAQPGSASTVTTLSVNGLAAKTLYFPGLTANTLQTTSPYPAWVRVGGVYAVVWDGTYLQVVNQQPYLGSTSFPGVVQLLSTYNNQSTQHAPSSYALYQLYNDMLKMTSGNFTPTFTNRTSTISYITRVGQYVKIGNVVTIAIMMVFTSTVSTDNMEISGLPFIASSQAHQPIASIIAGNATDSMGVNCYIKKNSATITRMINDGSKSDTMYFAGSYIAA